MKITYGLEDNRPRLQQGMVVALILVTWCLVFGSACSNPGSSGCVLDNDCGKNFACVSGVCIQLIAPDGDDGGVDGGDPGADQGGDFGWDAGADRGADLGADTGGDPGGDPGGPDGGDSGGDEFNGWRIEPGVGIGPLSVSQSIASAYTLGQARATLGMNGTATQGNYTLSFLNDSLWIMGIDSNGNSVFDDADRVISLVARNGLNALTNEDLGPGSSQAEVRAVLRYSNPDRSAVVPPYGDYLGGKVDEFFGLGLYIGYDENDIATAFTVTRQYIPPNGALNPSAGTLTFGGTTIVTGADSSNPGTERGVHLNALGGPDGQSNFEQEMDYEGTTFDVEFYVDSYRIQGMEFIGMEKVGLFDVDRLITVALYPFFYGQTSSGHGVGSTRAEWQQELGVHTSTKQDPAYDGLLYIYTAGSRLFAIMYANDGANINTDQAVLLILNYMET